MAMRSVVSHVGFLWSSSRKPSICRETPDSPASLASVHPRRSRRRRMTTASARHSGIGKSHVLCQPVSSPAFLFFIGPSLPKPVGQKLSKPQQKIRDMYLTQIRSKAATGFNRLSLFAGTAINTIACFQKQSFLQASPICVIYILPEKKCLPPSPRC
jgi:hypothetical protein